MSSLQKTYKETIPDGYKMTKVGVIPEDWEVNKLKNIGLFRKGKNISTKDTINSGLSAMMYGDIYVKYDTFFNNVDYKISKETASKSTPISNKDLLFTCSGETAKEIGKCVCYTGNETVYIGGDILAFSQNKQDSLFLAYQQNYYQQIKQKARMGQGNSVVHIYEKQIGSLNIPIPPLPEQHKIAKILSTQNKVIELKEELLEEKKKQKKYLMQILLNPDSPHFKRLDGFSGEWEKVKVDNIFKLTRGQVLSTTKCNDSHEYPVYSSQTKNDGLLGYYNEFLFEDSITWTTDGANAGKVKYRSGKFYCTNVCGVLISNQSYSNICIAKILDRITKHYVSYVGNPKLMNNVMAIIKVKIPKSIKEQKYISRMFYLVDLKIAILEKEIDEQKKKKKALMQMLLTGKVRVKV